MLQRRHVDEKTLLFRETDETERTVALFALTVLKNNAQTSPDI